MAEERLARAIEALVERQAREPPPAAPLFKAPQFDGSGDVEYYIRQFRDVAEANQWAEAAQLLYLRESLKDGARDCGKAQTVNGVFDTLRVRYGLTPREARARLTALKKDSRTTLQEHATEVERLVSIAYGEMEADQQVHVAVETFAATLNHAYLQRHLLAVETPTLETAVRAGNEFLQIRPSYGNQAVRTMEDEEVADSARVSPVTTESMMNTMMGVLQSMVNQLERMTVQPKSGRAGQSNNKEKSNKKCWGCGKEGHLRKDCPTQPWEAQTQTGNEESPQQ